jgi:hypothetical protein|tara:strand:- start:105 stop:572 length:468 start_codon:yes stop_codon:yes gene_type:complete
MALSTKKYETIHPETGDKLASLKGKFDDGYHLIATEHPEDFPELAAIIYQIQNMQEEIDYLRGVINTNDGKVSMALGTSGSTALAGDTTIISSSQASAITANTAKVSLVGGSKTTLSFGEMITVSPSKKGGATTYHIIMTATKGGVAKTVQLTLT